MGGGECALGDAAVGEETLNYGVDDVDMANADSGTEQVPAADASAAAGGAGAGGGQAEKARPEGKKKRRKRKNKGRQYVPPINIADIDRSVLNICKRLKEKKWHLVWITEECLGATAVSDLVREVEAIQKCGGQTTADGSRLRTGGGILWNILKSWEPKAYNEIMARGKELEKYFRYKKRPQISRKEDGSSQGSALIDDETEPQERKRKCWRHLHQTIKLNANHWRTESAFLLLMTICLKSERYTENHLKHFEDYASARVVRPKGMAHNCKSMSMN